MSDPYKTGLTCTECGWYTRNSRRIDEFSYCERCMGDVCPRCVRKTAVPEDEGEYVCATCRKRQAEKARIERGEFTAAELEEQGQMRLLD